MEILIFSFRFTSKSVTYLKQTSNFKLQLVLLFQINIQRKHNFNGVILITISMYKGEIILRIF